MDEFVVRALIGAVVLAGMLGPLGAFVVWRRMAYFGDTVAHSALLGVALSLMSDGLVPMPVAIFAVAVSVAVLLTHYSRDGRFQADTLLGILAHGALAFGVLLVGLSGAARVDLNTYLFGDILGIGWGEIAWLCVAACVVITALVRKWRALLMATIEPNIAAVEGVPVAKMHLLLTLLLAGVIALSIKLVGALLITALLIIPAAAARYVASSPKQMAVAASLLGAGAAVSGLLVSLEIDAPSGPMMVVMAVLIFVGCGLYKRA